MAFVSISDSHARAETFSDPAAVFGSAQTDKKKPHRPAGVAKRGGLCARRDRGEYDKAAGVAASKVIRVPVPMSAFGGKADISSGSL